MHDEHPHPLLAQLPLTLSPFLSLPTPTPLPYTYTHLPSSLPPSILSSPSQPSSTQNPSTQNPSSTTNPSTSNHPPSPAYISHTPASPPTTASSLLQSCSALQAHLMKLEADAKETLKRWEERRREEELAEKRRVAPGWLDTDVRVLRPEGQEEERKGGEEEGKGKEGREEGEAEALDRAFGGMGLK